jgi:hypothetical protein
MFDAELDIEIGNMPKRRRAMLYMLDHPKGYGSYQAQLAYDLCQILIANGHPLCAYAITMRLSGVRVRMIDTEVIILNES